MLVVRFGEWHYREELILNGTGFVVMFWGGQYREELVQNVTVFYLSV